MTDLLFQCANPVEHHPRPLVPVDHHVVPQSWGGHDTAPNTVGTPGHPNNRVRICGLCHDNVHDLINAYRHHGGLPPWSVRRLYSPRIRLWADLAWQHRPNDTPPWTLSHEHVA